MSSLAEAPPASRSRVSARIERRQRAEIGVVFEIAREHVRKGHSQELAFNSLAIGAADMQRRLRHRGIHASENTIRSDLGEAAGQLPRAAFGELHFKRALTYSLVALAQRFGTYGVRLLGDFAGWAFGFGSTPPSPMNSALSASSNLRVRGYLKWAVEHACEGVRSAIGNRLAWACATQFGLPESETAKVMTEYQTCVPRGRHPYAPREAIATLRSVYRRSAALDASAPPSTD